MISGIQKCKSWRDYVTQGAEPLPLEAVRAIFQVSVFKPGSNKRLDIKKLRNKAVAVSMIVHGWHQSGSLKSWIDRTNKTQENRR